MDKINTHIPETYFFYDNGSIPNSKYPVVNYRNVFTEAGHKSANWLEHTFKLYNWTNSWRWGIYDFHHFHSNTHEVLGVYQGTATLLLGGENGDRLDFHIGDIIIIPAGVGHKCLSHSSDFAVVGAYPNGKSADLIKGDEGDRQQIDKNIAQVPVPDTDPLLGKEGGIVALWK